jgi:cobaltochelatase CobN
MFDGRSVWFQAVNTPEHVILIFDYVEMMIGADRFLPPPSELASHAFHFYDWDRRDDQSGRCAAPPSR